IGVDEVGSKGRATMGVMLVRLDEGARVVGFDRVDDGGQPAPVGDADAARGGASATDGDDDA
ncbi:hypothetical protein, partial [uncultured Desulfovibrio sp.]